MLLVYCGLPDIVLYVKYSVLSEKIFSCKFSSYFIFVSGVLASLHKLQLQSFIDTLFYHYYNAKCFLLALWLGALNIGSVRVCTKNDF